jgi:phosphonate transport system substrate-binding protein
MRGLEVRLSAVLEMPVRVCRAPDYDHLEQMMISGEAQFGWLPPAVFARLEVQHGVRLLLATVRAERAQFSSALFCVSNSNIRDLRDLEGVRAVWVSPGSCSGFLYPRLALRDAGLPVEALFAEETFVSSHQEVLREVLAGRADVGATFVRGRPPHPVPSDLGGADIRTDGLRILCHRGGIPSDTLCGGPSAPASLTKLLVATVQGLAGDDVGRRVLRTLFDAEGFASASSEDYLDVRRALAVEEAGSVV